MTTPDDVCDGHGAVIRTSDDLVTDACRAAPTGPLTRGYREALALVHPEILERSHGCGSPIPPALEGCRVLDLGCGAGRDSFVASRLVGPSGSVIGVDMTEEPLAVARRHVGWHTTRFGFERPNVEFRAGDLTDLAACGIEDASVDVVIANCVVNGASDKEQLFAEICRVLGRGGEVSFATVFSDRRVPADGWTDPALVGDCSRGALYVGDLRRLLRRVGCLDHRVVERRRLEPADAAIDGRPAETAFEALTIRAFRVPGLEDACEDYGQVAVYRGTVTDLPDRFRLDERHVFVTGQPTPVCGNTAVMLTQTRLAPHFRVHADRRTHVGVFACGPAVCTERAQVAACP